jgi:hypothetical protein
MLTPNDMHTRLQQRSRESRKLAERLARLDKDLAAARKLLQDKEDLGARRQASLSRLLGRAGQAEDAGYSLDKDMKAVAAARDELAAIDDAATTLRTTVIPNLQHERNETHKALTHACERQCREVLPEVEKEMTNALGEVVRLRDDFLGACQIYCSSFNVGFAVGSSENTPRPQHPRIDRHRRYLVKPVESMQRMAFVEKLKKSLGL